MNDFSELEAELKQLQPATPSAELVTLVEQALELEPVEASIAGREARAGSWQLAVRACREQLQALRTRLQKSWGRFALGLGAVAAAAVLLLLARVEGDRPPTAAPAAQVAALNPAPRVTSESSSGLVPDGLTRVVYQTRNEGLVFPREGNAAPVRRVRSRSRETLRWRDPGTGASLRVSYPTEVVDFIPVSGQ